MSRDDGQTMRTWVFLIVSYVLLAGCAARKPLSISGSDAIEVWDQRTSTFGAKPKRIVDPTKVTDIVKMIEGAPGTWRSGDFTAPSGDVRLVFYRGPTELDRVGIGKGGLVCGDNSGWLDKGISPELEARLRDACW